MSTHDIHNCEWEHCVRDLYYILIRITTVIVYVTKHSNIHIIFKTIIFVLYTSYTYLIKINMITKIHVL